MAQTQSKPTAVSNPMDAIFSALGIKPQAAIKPKRKAGAAGRVAALLSEATLQHPAFDAIVQYLRATGGATMDEAIPVPEASNGNGWRNSLARALGVQGLDVRINSYDADGNKLDGKAIKAGAKVSGIRFGAKLS